MTMSIELMKEAAAALVPEKKVVAIENVRAFRWLVVSVPVDATIRARFDGKDRVSVSIDGYAEAACVLADAYPVALAGDDAPLVDARSSGVSAASMYDERWMFHGPAYRGIVDTGTMTNDAIRGELVTPVAKGALLDNAGQLFGFWVMKSFETDRLAMPVKIDRVSFFGPHPENGERLTCTVRIRSHGARDVTADLSLDRGGRAWATISGWEDRRFDTDARLWPVMIFPEKNLLAEPQPEGFTLFLDKYRSAPTRDQLARRFLGEKERRDYDAQGPRKQRAWLSGRIAAKDAVRDLLWRHGSGPLFPVEIALSNDENGRPRVRAPCSIPASGGPYEGEVRVSIAHKDDLAVAIASLERDVGIDVERVEPRPDGFAELSFTDVERRMIANAGNAEEAMTELWAAKEAVAKAEGTGLSGNPRRFELKDKGDRRLLVAGRWVSLRRHGEYVIAWTEP
jgi:phosphopantetheinyl transferase (holo-ACP synthase)